MSREVPDRRGNFAKYILHIANPAFHGEIISLDARDDLEMVEVEGKTRVFLGAFCYTVKETFEEVKMLRCRAYNNYHVAMGNLDRRYVKTGPTRLEKYDDKRPNT